MTIIQDYYTQAVYECAAQSGDSDQLLGRVLAGKQLNDFIHFGTETSVQVKVSDGDVAVGAK